MDDIKNFVLQFHLNIAYGPGTNFEYEEDANHMAEFLRMKINELCLEYLPNYADLTETEGEMN